ncbi:hypothetical protein OKA05_25120 [Luteolibacter arcticus]|uniref:Uncharacterized protein n=1 Tax=Luteolibacter arcticus TaxID=1581411 RepID=A0ABT3GQV1_9BACT|nr:hypothetical protein [Luteolibacter arcticus]MCW1925865.1 hypothetical protein [Luteolibacter arcticus]
MKSSRVKRQPPAAPAKSARKPRPKSPAVTDAPRDRLFEALREELGL